MTKLTSLLAILALAACARGENAATDTTTAMAAPTVNADTKAANVANAIASNPAAADSILTANGYTRESFEAEIFAIAADSTRSAAFAAAKAP